MLIMFNFFYNRILKQYVTISITTEAAVDVKLFGDATPRALIPISKYLRQR